MNIFNAIIIKLNAYTEIVTAYYRFGGHLLIFLFFNALILYFLIIERVLFFKEHKIIMRNHLKFWNVKTSVLTKQRIKLFFDQQPKNRLHDFLKQRLRQSPKDMVGFKHLKARQFLTTIKICTISAPLFGLLGTVEGLIETFTVLANHNLPTTASFAAGISKALYTTQLGLIIAIPGYFALHYLQNKAQRLSESAETILKMAQKACSGEY